MEEQIVKKRPLWQKLLIAAGIIILIIALVIISGKVFEKKENNGQAGWSNKDCESNPNPLFTAEFTDLGKIDVLNPIGSINAGSPGRAYIHIKGEQGQPSQKVPIYAPVDATLEGIVYARRNQSDPNSRGEYRLDFRVSCEVIFSFDHISDIKDDLKMLVPTEPDSRTNEATKVSVKIKAGEVLGETDGAMRNGSWDFYLLNYSKEVYHISPERWTWDQTKYAYCPYDYFTPDLKQKYYDKLKAVGGETLPENPSGVGAGKCGSPSHDVLGTASGGWFQDDSTSSKGLWLEIADATKKVELIVRNSGNHDFKVRDYQPEIMPDKLTVGNSACYSEENRWAYIRVDSNEQLSFVKGEGSCPSSFPTSNFEQWQR